MLGSVLLHGQHAARGRSSAPRRHGPPPVGVPARRHCLDKGNGGCRWRVGARGWGDGRRGADGLVIRGRGQHGWWHGGAARQRGGHFQRGGADHSGNLQGRQWAQRFARGKAGMGGGEGGGRGGGRPQGDKELADNRGKHRSKAASPAQHGLPAQQNGPPAAQLERRQQGDQNHRAAGLACASFFTVSASSAASRDSSADRLPGAAPAASAAAGGASAGCAAASAAGCAEGGAAAGGT